MLLFGRRERRSARHPAEASFAAPEVGNGRGQMVGVEVGPQGVEEAKFGIGAFPQQEIRQPLLAVGTDEKIDVGTSSSGGQHPAKGVA
jgi:hypothetical protein